MYVYSPIQLVARSRVVPHEHLQLATAQHQYVRLGALGCGVESDLAAAAGGDVPAGGETGPLQAAHVCVQPRRQIAATRRFLRGRIQRATTRLWSLLHGGAWQHVVGVSWRGAGIHTSMAIHGGESLTVRRHGRQWASPTGTHRGSLLPPPRGT